MKAILNQVFAAIFFATNLLPFGSVANAQNRAQNNSSQLGRPATTEIQYNFDPQSGRVDLPKSTEEMFSRADRIDDRATEEDYREYSPREIRQKFDELHRQANLQKGRLKDAVKSSAIHFGTETMYFQIVLGAMAVHQTMARHAYDLNSGKIDEHNKNPIAYEMLYESLKDPVAHLSFYNFMVANRYVASWMTDHLVKPSNKKLFLQLFVPGVSMSAGSIVSHLTGQAYMTFKACALDLYKKGRQRQSLGLSYHEPKNSSSEQQYDPCEDAWKMWTSEKLFYTLAPTLTAMLLATLTGGLSSYLVRTLLYQKTVDKVTGQPKLVARAALRNSRLAAIKALRLSGFSWKFWFGKTGGVVPAAIRVGAKLGHISVFLVAHEKFMDETERIMGNIFKGSFLGYLVPGKNMSQMGSELYALMQSPRNDDWVKRANTYVSDLSDSMTEWRRINNASVDKAHGMWSEKTTEFLTSVRMAKQYYAQLIDDMKLAESQKRNPISKDNMQIPANNFAYRTYPLYGVTPWPDPEAYPDSDEIANHYFKNPDRLEADQMKNVEAQAKVFCQDIQTKDLDNYPRARPILNKICEDLSSKDRHRIAQGILTINNYLIVRDKKILEQPEFLGGLATHLMSKLRKALGNPHPLLYPLEGYSYAFEVFHQHRLHAETFPKTQMGRYYREKISDYLIFKMLCGSQNDQEMIADKDGWKLRFNPPKIVTVQKIQSPVNFCTDTAQAPHSENRSALIYRNQIVTEKGTYKGIGELVLNNLLPEIRELIYSDDPTNNMNVWWEKKYSPAIDSTFRGLKDEYRLVGKKLIENLFQERSLFNFGPASNSLVDIMGQEVRTNLMIQAELFKMLTAQNPQIDNSEVWAPSEIVDSYQQKYQPDTPVSKSLLDKSFANFGRSGILDLQRYLWLFDFNIIKAHQNRQTIPRPQVLVAHANIQRLLMNQMALLTNLDLEINEKGQVVNVANFNKAEDIRTFDEQVKKIDDYLTDLFGPFNMTPAQAKLAELTTLNIKRVLMEIHTYLLLFEGINSDTALTENNANKPTDNKTTRVRGGRAQ